MHPFNLKAALAGAKVVTRNGEPVTQLHKFQGIKDSMRIYGVHDGEVCTWSESGRFHYYDKETRLDLFMAEAAEQAVSVPTAAEVFAAFDAALEADKQETWSGAYKDSTPAGRQRSREAWARVAELRAILAGEYEPHPDDIAVDKFAAAMKAKMAKQRAKGYDGWDDEAACPVDRLQSMLVEHVAKGDPVDVGNFAMMLFNRDARTTMPQQAASVPDGIVVTKVQLLWLVPGSISFQTPIPEPEFSVVRAGIDAFFKKVNDNIEALIAAAPSAPKPEQQK